MADQSERRQHERALSTARILWSTVGALDLQLDRLRNVSASGALVTAEALARVGDEIRFDLLDDAGEKSASGLARVVWVMAGKGMGISFLALGIDPSVVATLSAMADERRKPPPLPGKIGGPPPMPVVEYADEADIHSDSILAEIEPLAVKAPGVVIGIDLGTTNTCASYVADGKPRIIPGRTGTSSIPSMVTFDPDGEAYVGQRASDRRVFYPLRTVYGSKRLIGRTWRDDVAAELQRRFAFPLGRADGQRFGIRLSDRVVSMERIAAHVLDEVKRTAEEHLGERVEAAVITVPAYFNDAQRDSVRRAAAEAKLVVHRIVNEPTAAAVAYGHKQGHAKARVAVWDLGGGTFDFSLVDVTEGNVEVVATGGDNFVGGSDFDDLLAAHLIAEFERAEGIALEPDPVQIARLRDAAELAKRALSVQTEFTVEIPELTSAPKRALRVEVTRATFETLARPLIERTVEIAREVMASQSVDPKEVDDVLLVGGSTRMPAVQGAVSALFGKRPSKRVNPDEAVALGAALLGSEIGTGPTLLDVLPMSVGHGAPGLRFIPVAPRNTRLPFAREVTVDADHLGTAALPLFQGEAQDVSEDEYLLSVVVEEPSRMDGGRVIVRISFDEHCVMAIEAREPRTGRGLPVRLDRSRSADEVLRELGRLDGPPTPPPTRPQTGLGKVFGKLSELFGR